MQATSYLISRENGLIFLVSEENQLFMKKNTKANVYLTTTDDLYGILHDDKKIYSFVKIEKKSDFYSLKNLDNGFYFCSKPLSDNDHKNPFIANRLVSSTWEEFQFKEIEIEINDYYSNMIEFLKNYKKKEDVVNLYWWRGKDFINFGDELNLYIVSYLTNKEIKRVEQKNQTDLIGIGSILDWFPKRKNSYPVWGSGTLAPAKLLRDEDYSISLLRGPLTKSLFKKNIEVPYGDPGILTSLVWEKSSPQMYDWGLLVHFSQEKQPWVQNLIKNTPNSILISAKNEDMTGLMSQISSCRNIASTSLHGLIVADSYCIPNIWLWTDNIHKGGQWKFFDYFSGINRLYVDNINPKNINSLLEIKLQSSNFGHFDQIANIQNRIIKSFPLK